MLADAVRDGALTVSRLVVAVGALSDLATKLTQ
jgi:hypothetical protein